MGFENFISEDQAARVAGVSTVTLKRFAEAGYLSVETDTDGLRLFSKRELSEVFGIPVQEDTESNVERLESLREKVEVIRDRNHDQATPDLSFLDRWSEDGKEPETSMDNLSSEVMEGETSTEPERLAESTSPEEVKNTSETEPQTAPVSDNDDHVQEKLLLLEREVTRLTNITNLQEKVLDLKEAEIADLKRQREWLEERVIRLEEKSDRDQLLLLSETQLVRQLIEVQRRRTPLRMALEWMGLVQPETPKGLPTGKPIEISKETPSQKE